MPMKPTGTGLVYRVFKLIYNKFKLFCDFLNWIVSKFLLAIVKRTKNFSFGKPQSLEHIYKKNCLWDLQLY